ncbi:siderophore-interacting protein [Williamsia sterculiae]|nr:siderophore-interacting protein [Williamsia sterculiae]
MKHRLLDRFLVPARVHAAESVGPRLRRITLTGPGVSGLSWVPGQQVRLQVAAATAALDWLVGTLRTYSVWEYDGESMELIVFEHGDGPGAGWAGTVKAGDELMLLKPEGSFTVVPEADYHLFVGEETAQVAFGPILRALPVGARVFGHLEVDSPDERLDLGNADDHQVTWSYRRGESAAASTTLVDALRGLDLPPTPGVAYLAGEARTIQLVRRHLVEERGWSRRDVRTKPFWTPGRKGLD